MALPRALAPTQGGQGEFCRHPGPRVLGVLGLDGVVLLTDETLALISLRVAKMIVSKERWGTYRLQAKLESELSNLCNFSKSDFRKHHLEHRILPLT